MVAADDVASFVKGVNSLSAHFLVLDLIVSLTHIVSLYFMVARNKNDHNYKVCNYRVDQKK